MATDKRFVVKNGLQTENINFVFNDAVLGSSNITATMLSSNTLSFSGSTGQLFSITDSMTGVIFAVNDISGVPSIEVYDDGRVYFAETFGNVAVGNGASSTSTSTGVLQVTGGAGITGNINAGGTRNLFTGSVGVGTSTALGTNANVFSVYGTAMVYGNVDLANPTGGTSGIYFNDGSYQTTAFTGAATPSFGTAGTVQYAGAGNTFAGNSDNFFWDAANSRLGIGTNAPTNVLTVRSTATPAWFNTINSAVGTNNYEIIVGNGTSTGTTVGYVNNTTVPYGYLSAGTTTRNITIAANGRVGIGGVTAPQVLLDVGGGAVIGASWAGNSNFINPPTNGVAVQGSVGIGTYTPRSALDVRGGIGVTAASNFGGAVAVASLASNGAVSGTTGTFSANLTVDTNTFFVDSVGNKVGVLTTTPTAVLDVVGGNGDGIQFRTGTRNITLGQFNNEVGISWGSGSVFTLQSGGLERARIDSNGNVGIGTATVSAGYRLQVQGSIKSTGTVDADVQFLGQPGDTAGAPSFSWTGDTNVGMFRPATNTIGFTTAGTERMRVDANGRVGIATTAPGSTLDVNGIASIRSDMSVAGTATVNALVSNGAVSGTTITGTAGTFTSIQNSGQTLTNTLIANVFARFGQNVEIDSSNTSTTTSTGAFVVAGGAGIGGRLNVGGSAWFASRLNAGGAFIAQSINSNTNVVGVNLQSTGQASVDSLVSNGAVSGTTIDGTDATFASLQVAGTTTSNVLISNIYGYFGQNVRIDSSNVSATSTTGALVVDGGVGIGGRLNTGLSIYSGSRINAASDLIGNAIRSNTNVVGVNLQSTGQASVDSLVSNGAISGTTINGTDATFASLQVAGTTTSNVLISNIYGYFGQNVRIDSSNVSSSTSTGALVVDGGVGMGGRLNTGGSIYSGSRINAASDLIGNAIRSNTNVVATNLQSTGQASVASLVSNGAISGTTIDGTDATFSGNVGIGTATVSAGYRLQVQGSIKSTGTVDADVQFLGQPGDTAGAPSFSWTGDTNVGMFRPTTDTIGFTTAGTERMRVNATGSVGIATTAPGSTLDVNGVASIRSAMSVAGTATVNALTSNGAVSGTTGTFTSDLYSANFNTAGTATVNALVSNTSVKTATVNASSTIVGQNIYSNGFVQAAGTVRGGTITSNTTVTAGTGLTVTSGGINISGFSQFTGNVSIAGNLNVTGTISTQNANVLIVQDPIIYLGEGNTGDNWDIGIVGNYNDGVYEHTGFVRNHVTGTWTLFDTLPTEPNVSTGNVDWSNSSLTYAAFLVGNVNVAGQTASISTTTGAITVPGQGGVGIGGRLNVGGAAWFASTLTAGGAFRAQSINSNTNVVGVNLQSTGQATVASLVSNGAISGTTGTFTGALYSASFNTAGTATVNALVSNGAVSGTTITGTAGTFTSIQNSGNLRSANIVSNTWIHATQNLTVASSNASTSTTTGAFVLSGGAGIAGNINAGGTRNLFTGSVGVGTSAVLGTTANVFSVYGTAMIYGNVDLRNPTGGTSGVFFGDGTYQTTAFTGSTSTPSFGAAGTIQVAGAGNTFSGDSGTFVFDTANDRLGIGTSTPTNVLSVWSTATPAWFNTINSAVGTNSYEILVGNGTSTGTTVGYVNNTAVPYGYLSAGTTTRNITIAANGRVGIGGVTAPRVLLDVGGGAVIGASWAGNSNFINPPANGVAVQGSVGIGTYTPLAALDVRGGVGVTAASNFGGAVTVASLASNGAVSGTTGTFTGALYGANFNTAGTATVNALVSNGAVSGTTGTFSGDLSIADKIVHTGDTNTAIRFPTNDTVTIETNGIERFRVDLNGNIGIGSSSPAAKLDIITSEDRGLRVSGPLSDTVYFTAFHGGISNNLRDIGLRGANIRFETGATTGTTSTEHMRIDANGNVGIATTTVSAGYKLQVQGSIKSTGTVDADIQFLGQPSDTAGAPSFSWTGDTNVGMFRPATDTIGFSTAGAERMRIDSNGNVGIGTTSSTVRLTVSANTTNAPTPVTGTVAHFVGLNGSQSRVLNDSFGSPAQFIARTASGTATSPSAITAQTTFANFLGFGYGATGYTATGRASMSFNAEELWTDTAQGSYILFNTTAPGTTSSTGKVVITGTGNVGIGTGNPVYKLEVNGSFAAITKSFVIDHPTKPNMKLRYGSLEGPENGVYVRGRLRGESRITLPDYWTGLVDDSTITVNLTAIGRPQNLYVSDIDQNSVWIGADSDADIHCFYTVYAERKDIEKLTVEYGDH